MNRAFTTHLAASSRSVNGTLTEQKSNNTTAYIHERGGAICLWESMQVIYFESTLIYPTLLLSRNSDSLILPLSNKVSVLLIWRLALLLHESNNRALNMLQNLNNTITTRSLWAHSRSVALSVFIKSCLARRRMSGSNLEGEECWDLYLDPKTIIRAALFIFHLCYLLDILADLSLKAMPLLLELLDGAILRKLVGSAPHLALCQAAGEKLLHTNTRKPQVSLKPTY